MKIINKKDLSLDFIKSERLVNYNDAISFMEDRVEKILKKKENEAIWFLEHPSLFTAGRSFASKKSHLQNIPIFNSGRGGKMTWHGPGQRIIYFMIDIKKRNLDIRTFVSKLEIYIMDSLLELKIQTFKKEKLIGIWTKDLNHNDAKIASLGLRVSRGIIYHGISININCDLSLFKKIDVCGLKNSHVTSVYSLQSDTSISNVDKILKKNISRIFT